MLYSILTFILGVLSSYMISRNFELKSQIRMDINSFGIINDNIDSGNITLQCNGTKINILSKTSIIFWNSGRKCITKDEILGEQYIKIEFSQGVKIFDCKNVRSNEEENNIVVFSDDNCVIIKFDYLKPGNGAVIDILHNGDIRKEITPILNLKTNNKKDIIKVNSCIDWENVEKKKEMYYRYSRVSNAITLCIIMIAASISSIILPLLYIRNENVAIITAFVLVFICGGLSVVLFLYLKNSFYLKPKGLYRENKAKSSRGIAKNFILTNDANKRVKNS